MGRREMHVNRKAAMEGRRLATLQQAVEETHGPRRDRTRRADGRDLPRVGTMARRRAGLA